MGITAIAVSGYSFIFFLIAVLPTIVAIFIDKRISRAASNIIGAFNISGVFPYLYSLWSLGPEEANSKAQLLIVDMYTWLIIYSSAALGWVVIWGIPNFMARFLSFRSDEKRKYYRKEQINLYKEWQINYGNTTFRDYLVENQDKLDKL